MGLPVSLVSHDKALLLLLCLFLIGVVFFLCALCNMKKGERNSGFWPKRVTTNFSRIFEARQLSVASRLFEARNSVATSPPFARQKRIRSTSWKSQHGSLSGASLSVRQQRRRTISWKSPQDRSDHFLECSTSKLHQPPLCRTAADRDHFMGISRSSTIDITPRRPPESQECRTTEIRYKFLY